MFKRSKHSLTREISNETATAFDFRERGFFRGYRPISYEINPALDERVMLPKIEAYLKELFKGAVDDANGDVLNQLLFDEVRIGAQSLARQRLGHQDTISRLLGRWESDYRDIIALRDVRVKELQNAEEIHANTLERMEKGGYTYG